MDSYKVILEPNELGSIIKSNLALLTYYGNHQKINFLPTGTPRGNVILSVLNIHFLSLMNDLGSLELSIYNSTDESVGEGSLFELRIEMNRGQSFFFWKMLAIKWGIFSRYFVDNIWQFLGFADEKEQWLTVYGDNRTQLENLKEDIAAHFDGILAVSLVSRAGNF